MSCWYCDGAGSAVTGAETSAVSSSVMSPLGKTVIGGFLVLAFGPPVNAELTEETICGRLL